MANILIASLGESPIVVTAMYKLLTTEEKQRELGKIDKVVVLYPEKEDMIQLGYDLIEDALKGTCELESWMLPFEDANGEEESYTFLRLLFQLLFIQQESGNNVNLSLAGGRKNMSALIALVVPFFPCVKKLYHVLDRNEHTTGHTFKSIEELYELSDAARKEDLHPNLERLILVDIPYGEQQRVSDASLRKLLTITGEELDDLWEKNAAEAEAVQLYGSLARPDLPGKARSKANLVGKILSVFVTEHVRDDYRRMRDEDVLRARKFAECFKQMRYADRLADKFALHGFIRDKTLLFHYYKRPDSVERPFYHTEPEGIHRYPNADVRRVIISGLAVEQGNGKYEPPEALLLGLPLEPVLPIETLFPTESVLLVPLGASPMVATQLYTLLKSQEHTIHEVILLYPERSRVVRNSFELARKAFADNGVKCREVHVKGQTDIDSTQACIDYQQALEATIEDLHTQYPTCQIELALSGDRKGMTALTMFTAQRKHIPYVYHTLINDDELNRRIDRETTIEALSTIILLSRHVNQ